jgi:hypothetical protein
LVAIPEDAVHLNGVEIEGKAFEFIGGAHLLQGLATEGTGVIDGFRHVEVLGRLA